MNEQTELLKTLRKRFEDNKHRHRDITWETVEERLKANPEKLASLARMEATGGEPDVVGLDAKTGALFFCDCAPESPAGRRSLCYDDAALHARKENKPKGSAIALALAMGAELLTESQYRALQELEPFDRKTSSWVATPEHIRKLGGALFCDRRYDSVFLYHNGAESYYAARGFRVMLTV
ncbi:DUF4256 domain-containing protein [Flavobacterium longum]|uniref:DUF4256 domain-containing protein n=1 Tax=Flavobacterium longum TaxID=1299340 RepID=UPI0039EC769D